MKNYKQLGLALSAITLTACLGGNGGSGNVATVQAGQNKTVNATANYPRGSVSNWPNYIAMGTITNNGYFVGANSEYGMDNPTDAVFKYAGSNGAGDMGQIIFPQTTYRTIYEAQQYSAATGHLSRPVMVEYTLQLSGGDNGMVDLGANNMAYHFINLATDSYLMEVNGAANGYGSMVLNPDALGFLQQNYSNVKGSMARTFPVTQQLKASICYLTTPVNYSLTWSNTGQTIKYAGTPLQILQAITTQSKGAWIMSDSYSDWTSKAATWYSSCASNPVIPSDFEIPTFNDTFAGWIQATNWLIKKFGPDVTYGWHENISMLTSGSLWVGNYNAYDPLTETTIQNNVTNPTLDFLNNYQVFNGTYRPDFIVFDRYEVDDTQNMMYFYEDSDWTNFFTFVGQTSRGLGNIPVMLWQMPGGHIQIQNDVDKRGSHGGTLTNFLFGDSNLVLGTSCSNSNLQASWCGLYNLITAHNYKWNQDNGKLALAAQYNVFAILWGGGTGPTTGINGMGTYDGGWLASKVVNYYKNPQPVVITTPLPTPTVSPTPSPSPTPTTTPVGNCSGLNQWDSGAIYTADMQAYENNVIYKANWWNQGSQPSKNSGQYQVWSMVGNCPASTPTPSPTPSATPSPQPSASPSPKPSPSPSPSVAPVPSPTPSPVPTVSPSPVPTASPTPAPAKTGTVTISMPTVVSAYNGNLQVQLLNAKASNAVVATYTIKQGSSVTSGNLPISDSTHAYKVKLVNGVADPLNGVNYIESGTPAVAVKNGQNTSIAIPMKAVTTTKRTVTLALSGLQGSDKATISFADASGKYNYVGYSGYGNGNAVFKIENNQNLTVTVTTSSGAYQSASLSNSQVISANKTIALVFAAKPQPSLTPSPVPTVAPSPSPAPTVAPSPTPSPAPVCSGVSAWNSSTAYTAGNTVSYQGVIYKANWWTQNNNPSTNNGGSGSGKPWTKVSNC